MGVLRHVAQAGPGIAEIGELRLGGVEALVADIADAFRTAGAAAPRRPLPTVLPDHSVPRRPGLPPVWYTSLHSCYPSGGDGRRNAPPPFASPARLCSAVS